MNKELGNYIKKKREERKISQRELARRINIDNATVSKLENGKIEKPTFEVLIKISHELNIPILKLFKLANYNDVDKLIYSGKIEQIYENELLDKIEKQTLNKVMYITNHEIFLDIDKILNEYKKGNINKMDTIRLLTVCRPIDVENKLIYLCEKGDIVFEINDYNF